MRHSQLFTKTQKTSPKDEEAINAKLLIRGGFIRKLSAGVYSYLPLGWRVLGKIIQVIREEMNAIGGQELLMPALVAKEYWAKTERWNVPIVFRTKSPDHQDMPEFGLGWTHEEVVSQIAKDFISSYKDLPCAVYQIQTKFRAEPRAKNGLLRGREFLMKDLYSFHSDKKDLDSYYQIAIGAYQKILNRLSLNAKLTEASGGAFTKEYTHEFQVLSSAGEDTIFYCGDCDFSQNKEVATAKKGGRCPKCGGIVQESSGIEVANVFKLGTRYSEPFDLRFRDKNGEQKLAVMGSYGIGPTRIMGTLVEVLHDEKGIIWPEAVSPFKVHLVAIAGKSGGKVEKVADEVYTQLDKAGVEVLYDDREVSAGEKLADVDLLGISYRAIISEKTGAKIELKARNQGTTKLIGHNELIKLLR